MWSRRQQGGLDSTKPSAWETHPEFRSWTPERIAARHFEVASALRPAYAAVIADHVEFAAPVVFET
jgi:hypothetical protein